MKTWEMRIKISIISTRSLENMKLPEKVTVSRSKVQDNFSAPCEWRKGENDDWWFELLVSITLGLPWLTQLSTTALALLPSSDVSMSVEIEVNGTHKKKIASLADRSHQIMLCGEWREVFYCLIGADADRESMTAIDKYRTIVKMAIKSQHERSAAGKIIKSGKLLCRCFFLMFTHH